MGETEDTVNTFSTCFGVQAFDNLFHYTIDAANGGYYPYFISDTYLSVRAHIALECHFLTLVGSAGGGYMIILYVYVGVVELTFKVGLDVVMVKESTTSHGMTRMSDGETVFNNIFTLGNVAEGEFVTCGDVTYQSDIFAADADSRTRR